MKTLTISTSALRNSVAVANNFVQKEGDFAGMITLVGTDGKLEVKSSDFTQSVIFKNIDFVSSDLTDSNFNAFSINGKKLTTVLKAAKADEIQMEVHSEHITIKSGRSKVKIDTLANTQEIEISMNGESLDFGSYVGKMEQMLHTVDTNNPSYALNGLLLQVKNGVFNMVSTNAKNMAINTINTDLKDMDVVIPKEAVSTISKLFNGFDIKINVDDTCLSVDTQTICYQTKLINVSFPNWQRIVPKSVEQTITINRNGLKGLLEEASIFNDDVIVTIKDKKIIIVDLDERERSSTEVIDEVSDELANIKFAINSKGVINFLNSFTEDNVQLAYTASNLPIMMIASPEYKEIMMPIALSSIVLSEEEVRDAA